VSGLRVATFNIRNPLGVDWSHAWVFRRRATLAALTQLDADVIGLQEAYGCQLRWLMSRLPDTTVAGEGRSRRKRGEHTPVLVRAGSEVRSDATRWFGASPDVAGTRLAGACFPRIATTARVRLLDGTELSVTSTHLDERSNERRLESASQLVDWLAADRSPQVVLGDFNATPRSDVMARFVDAGFTRLDTGASGTTHHFRGGTDGRIIDHILVRGNVDVIAAGVSHERPGGQLPSDHWPVWADLEVG
jgi:endonuclease/exonuclease/phosphatase family metal-dependent hydrolase